jgi:SAM-dependent methyltransferase
VRLGFAVTACDVSPSMAAIATQRLGSSADVLVADMRELPESIGRFDLVTCLDDAVNYLTDVDDLRGAFASARRALAPDGVYVFDVNTLHAYDTAFDVDFVADRGEVVFCWSARTDADHRGSPDGRHVAQLDDAVEPRVVVISGGEPVVRRGHRLVRGEGRTCHTQGHRT